MKEEVTEREERAAKVLKGFEGRVKELRGQYDEEREGWEREVGSLREGEVRALKRRREEAVRNECSESVKGVRVVLEREKTEALESVGGSASRRLEDLKKEWEAREKALLR